MIEVKAIRWGAFLLAAFFPFLVSAQCVSGNCKNGKGMYRYNSGAKYSGDFYDSRPHGTGTLKYTNGNRYTGQWQSGMREGRGKLTFKNGNVFEGHFLRNKIKGHGTMYYQNKDRYEGIWSDNAPNGQGKYYFSSGERYEGSFQDGKFEGEGVMYYPDGATYSGQWHDNRKHGAGRMQLPDGSASNGRWEFGNLVAGSANSHTADEIIETEQEAVASAAVDVGNLRNCSSVYCRNGKGYLDYSDGSRYIGQFKEGYPEGKGICYYSNGDRYEGYWKDNAPNGEGIMYFASGRVYGAIWMNGAPVRDLETTEPLPSVEDVPTDISKKIKVWAVVVGVSDYAHMPKLKYTDDDAYQFYAFLKSPEGGALPDNQIEILVDDNATRNNILKTMRRTFARADANDEVVLYFSGHGLEGSFLPVDFDGHNNSLRHKDVLRVFAESKAKYKLCIADACHSGTLNDDQGLAAKSPVMVTLDRYYKAFEAAGGGTALLMSSKGEEVSLEDQGLRQGIFSHYLLRGLKGQADVNEDRVITIHELYSYIYKEVRRYTSNAQTPILTGDYDMAMPVSVKR